MPSPMTFGVRSNPPCGDCHPDGECSMNCGPKPMTNPNTETPDIAGLVKRIRSKGAGSMTKILLMHEAADALEALQAERDELNTRLSNCARGATKIAMREEQQKATIASLREALEEIDGQAVCVGMAKDWNEASDMLVNVHMIAKKALALNPDIGTTPKEEKTNG